ncbi:MAG: hypothetical protein JWR01_2155, partial [Subtercola sp.]|nr:hypothetical protein [Subtercola sp.]
MTGAGAFDDPLAAAPPAEPPRADPDRDPLTAAKTPSLLSG